jgi:murein L,D-transpeptidase YafK
MTGLSAAKSLGAGVHREGMLYSIGMLASRLLRKSKLRLIPSSITLLISSSGLLLHAMPASPDQQRADSILILKKDHMMQLTAAGKVIRTYKVALGQGGLAPKQREGDELTPEGHYVIDAKYDHSKYHKALHVSYPNAEDRKRAARQRVSPGGAIMIHGLPNGKGWVGARHRLFDWTLGCIAVTERSTTPYPARASNLQVFL